MLKVVHQSGETETSAFDGFLILKDCFKNKNISESLHVTLKKFSI